MPLRLVSWLLGLGGGGGGVSEFSAGSIVKSSGKVCIPEMCAELGLLLMCVILCLQCPSMYCPPVVFGCGEAALPQSRV